MAYGKLFDSIFDSSINEEELPVRWVFVTMIALSDREGVLDITRNALARRANVTRRQVTKAIEILSSPDPDSRNDELDGRRIIPIDSHRDWGWIVVSKKNYRSAKDLDEVRENNRNRKRKQRERNAEAPENTPSGHADVTRSHGSSHHTKADTETKAEKEEQTPSESGGGPQEHPQRKRIKVIGDAWSERSSRAPDFKFLAKLVKDYGDEVVLAKVTELGDDGHLEKGAAYLRAALEGKGRISAVPDNPPEPPPLLPIDPSLVSGWLEQLDRSVDKFRAENPEPDEGSREHRAWQAKLYREKRVKWDEYIELREKVTA